MSFANSGWLLLNRPKTIDTEDPAVTRVGDEDLFLARSVEILRCASEESVSDIRFYLGYAGWGPGQLEFEIAQGAWLSAPATSELIFDVEYDRMWDRAVRGLGIDPSTLVSISGIH